MDGPDDEDGHGVRPGEERVLAPPPAHDQRHVEAEHEGEGDGGHLVVAVGHHRLEHLPSLLPLKTYSLISEIIRTLI